MQFAKLFLHICPYISFNYEVCTNFMSMCLHIIIKINRGTLDQNAQQMKSEQLMMVWG